MRPLALQILLDNVGAMNRCTIPNNQELAGYLFGKLLQKGDDLFFADAVSIAVRKNPAIMADAADGGELVPFAAVADFRSLSSRCPSRAPHTFEARPDFVHKHHRGVF